VFNAKLPNDFDKKQGRLVGGIGSGNWYRWSTGPRVEDGLTLDLNKLIRDGLVGLTSRAGTLYWRRIGTGEEVASLGYEVVAHCQEDLELKLNYTVGRGEDRRPVRETIYLQTTRPHFGRLRWWFSCPNCGRRAAKLHSPPGGDRFLCRRCYGLSYASQREGPMFRTLTQAQKIRERLGGSGSTVDPFPEKPTGMHWRTYWRLSAKAMRYEQRSLALVAGRFGW
jgi:hypothetical protein